MSTHNIGFHEEMAKISIIIKYYQMCTLSVPLSAPESLVDFILIYAASQKNCHRGFHPGLTQTGLYNHRRW